MGERCRVWHSHAVPKITGQSVKVDFCIFVSPADLCAASRLKEFRVSELTLGQFRFRV